MSITTRKVAGAAAQTDAAALNAALHLLLNEPTTMGRRPTGQTATASRRVKFVRILVEQVASGAFDDSIDESFDGITPEVKAHVLAKVTPAVSTVAESVGPVVAASTLSDWKDVSKTALTKAQDRRELLGFKSGRQWLYPVFQLNEYGEYLPNLARVLNALDPNRVDDGSSAVWLNQPLVSLGGRTAAEALRDGDTDLVLRAAGDVAYGWAS